MIFNAAWRGLPSGFWPARVSLPGAARAAAAMRRGAAVEGRLRHQQLRRLLDDCPARGREADEELADVEAEFRLTSDGTAAEQQRIVDDLLTKGVDAIAISPVDPQNQSR